MASAVHFRSLDDTMDAFENRNVDAWSIWCGSKQFMFKGIGGETLRTHLENLMQGASNTVYTLKVYEGIDDAGSIKSTTPDDGSFNFRLNGENMPIMGNHLAQYEKRGSMLETLKEIAEGQKAINERLDQLENEQAEEEPENKLGVIGDILGHPVIAPIAPKLIETFMTMLIGGTPPAATAQVTRASIGNIPANTTATHNNSELNAAIETLKLYDPKLTEHLQKLARIAEADKQSFSFLLTSLEAIQV